MLAIDRRYFVMDADKSNSYLDAARPIGFHATISAPHIHAMSLSVLADAIIHKNSPHILDVGSGSGYLSVCLAELVCSLPLFLLCNPNDVEQAGPTGRVFGVDHIPELVEYSLQAIRRVRPDFLTSGRVTIKCPCFSLHDSNKQSLLNRCGRWYSRPS